MALTRDFKRTVFARAQREPAFAKALLDEAATLFLNGEPEAARLILREVVNATIGFETLAAVNVVGAEAKLRRFGRRDGRGENLDVERAGRRSARDPQRQIPHDADQHQYGDAEQPGTTRRCAGRDRRRGNDRLGTRSRANRTGIATRKASRVVHAVSLRAAVDTASRATTAR